MALSHQVKVSLESASDHLREALAFAARNEKPFFIREIGNMIHSIDAIQNTDELLDNVDNILKHYDEDKE
tara:strand:+ start:338 stop:547 length:210 start_codon:yes stop_codon:yes gene_type:complete